MKKTIKIISNEPELSPNKNNEPELSPNKNNEPFNDHLVDIILEKIEDVQLENMHVIKNNILDEMKQYVDNALPVNSNSQDSTTDMKQEILETYIYPSCKKDIATSLSGQKFWNFLAGIFLALKYLCLASAPIFAFSVSSFPEYPKLSYVSGSIGIGGMACERLALFCTNTSRKKTEKMNILLESLGIRYKKPDTAFEDPLAQQVPNGSSYRRQTASSSPNNMSSSIRS